MNLNYKKLGIVFGSIFVCIYALFLILPFALTPIANKYAPEIEKIIKESTGYNTEISGLGVITSPKLAIGIKAKDFKMAISDKNQEFLVVNNFKIKLSLLPLILKKVQFDSISANSISANLDVKKDGNFLILDYLKIPNNKDEQNEQTLNGLPFNFKLSNHLPNISLKSYKIVLKDISSSKSYYVEGQNLKISDFVLDKKIKISTAGKVVLENETVSNFDVKIFNKIMPDVDFDDLIFPKTVETNDENVTQSDNALPFNIIEILKAVKSNGLTANLKMNVKTFGTIKDPIQQGKFSIDNISAKVGANQLPHSYMNLIFKGKKTDIDSIFYTSSDKNEKTQIIGSIKSGKNKAIDLTFRSNAKFENIIRIIDSIAQTFEINDFKTLSATGAIDSDFNIKSDLKKVDSSGYLRIPQASLKYGIYNVSIDKINADIDLTNNNVSVNNFSASVMGNPLKMTGKITSDANTDLKIIADNLVLKGLITLAGQTQILKENDFNSGVVSLKALIKGRLNSLKPDINLTVNNINIFNKPSGFKVLLDNALIKLNIHKTDILGEIDVNNLGLKNSDASVSVPNAKILVDNKNINIKNSYLLVGNSRIDVKGIVTDYINDKLNIDITASGNLNSADIASFIPKGIRSMFPYKGSMPISVKADGNSKSQNIKIDLTATPSGYIQLADVNLLKGQNTKIHSDIKINGETLSFENTGIANNSGTIATLAGNIDKLYSSPKLNLNINVAQNVSFPIWGMGNSNITAKGKIDVSGNINNPIVKGDVNISDISIKDMDFVLTNLKANLNGPILHGSGTAEKFKFGGIEGSNINAKFSLIDYTTFYLNDLTADVFDGKVNGKISYNISNTGIGVNLTGKGLNSTEAVFGAIGIKNTLTGTMGFIANFTTKGVTDKAIFENLKGNIDFDVTDGRFMGIGRLENLVSAQNITSNSILKSAISALSTLNIMQETNKFKSITGSMTLANGMANISKILVSGPLMSYYVKGTYYIIPNTAYLVILGRLDSKTVSCLGVLGEFSAEKLLSYIPKFGTATAKFLQQLTADPVNENTALIPPLTTGSTNYKDFKVIMNGSVGAPSSVKNFKWLTKCDTTKIDIKQDMKNSVDAVKTNVQNQVKSVKTTVESVKTNTARIIQEQKNSVNQTKTDIQNVKQNASQSAVNLGKLFLNAAQKSQTKYEKPQEE